MTTLDGALTKYIAVNGQFPGPTIEVPFGAEVSVGLWVCGLILWCKHCILIVPTPSSI